MELELGIENILSEDEIESMFSENADDETSETETATEESAEEAEEETDEDDKDKDEDDKSTEVDFDNDKKQPESVGSDEDIDDSGTPSDKKSKGSSPNNFYTSITRALVEDGVLEISNEDEIANIKDADSLREAIAKQIENGISEKERRIAKALDSGIPADTIKYYKGATDWLDSVTDSMISAKDEEGKKLRANIIYQDYINRGFSDERAKRELKKSFDALTDIDDAKEALASNKEFFENKYNEMLEEASKAKRELVETEKRNAENFKKAIFNNKETIAGLTLNDATRKKIYDNVTNRKYSGKDGKMMSAIEKYQEENPQEFIKIVSTLWTATDGFKDFSSLSKQAVQKEKKKGLAALESVINSTPRNLDGSLNLASGVAFDDDTHFSGFKLNI